MTFINNLSKDSRDLVMGAAAYSVIKILDANELERGVVIVLCGSAIDNLVVGTNITHGANDDDRLRLVAALKHAAAQIEQQDPNRN
jgi:hypothetical protein